MAVSTKNQLSKDAINRVYAPHSIQSDFTDLDEYLAQIDKEGRTLLIHAVLAKNLILVNRFVAKGAKIEHNDKLG